MVKPSIQGHQYWEAWSLRAADVTVHHLERRVRQSHELPMCHQAVLLKETDALELYFQGNIINGRFSKLSRVFRGSNKGW